MSRRAIPPNLSLVSLLFLLRGATRRRRQFRRRMAGAGCAISVRLRGVFAGNSRVVPSRKLRRPPAEHTKRRGKCSRAANRRQPEYYKIFGCLCAPAARQTSERQPIDWPAPRRPPFDAVRLASPFARPPSLATLELAPNCAADRQEATAAAAARLGNSSSSLCGRRRATARMDTRKSRCNLWFFALAFS